VSAPADRLAGLSPEKRALLARRLAEKAPAAAPAAERIAIVSMACRLPGGANSPEAFWELLVEGRDAVTAVPAERWDGDALFSADPDAPNRIVSRSGGFLDAVDRFDAAFFGISPHEAALMDPQQRLLLELAWEALEAAGQPVDRLAGSATGVFIGAHSQSSDYWLLQLAQHGGVDSHSATGSAHSILANRISFALDLRGPSLTVDTACSSSLVAVHLACQSLRSGECDLALAGGVNLMLTPSASFAFSKLQILSPQGRCRTFDAAADGIARGEGCALIALKRLSDARRDGDTVLAVIAGSAVNQDGASNGLTAPNGPAQEAVIRRALAMAAISPERVGLVETHGTGTPLGDPVEVEALANVIGPPRDSLHRCYLGAVKTNIGHLEGAAGIAGVVKAVACLRHGAVPGNLHFVRPNPHLRLDGTPFVIPTALTPWLSPGAPRVASVSSFGFGGTNAHVVLEEHQPEAADGVSAGSGPEHVLMLSARSPDALKALAHAYSARLRELPVGALEDFVHTATTRRSHHNHRIAAIGANAAELAGQIEARIVERAEAQPVSSDAVRQPVFVFTGQGTHWGGMGRELYEAEPVFRAAVDAVCGEFNMLSGWDLLEILNDPSRESQLSVTEVAQPAIFALQVGLAALWKSWGVRPGAIIGHSVGEIAAAHVAGVLTLVEATNVVFHRSRAMRGARGHGSMAQIEIAEHDIASELAGLGPEISVAALNGPASVVVSGASGAMEKLLVRLQARGAVARVLPVDYAFHSAQMEPFIGPVVAALAALRPKAAELPLISTVSGTWRTSSDFDAAYWGRNVRNAVRFAPGVACLLDAGFRSFLEIGPHPSLGPGILASAGEREIEVSVAASLRRSQPARASLLAGLQALYEDGVAIDWSVRFDPRRRVVSLPAYPWQRQRHWLDAPDPAALAFHVTGRKPRNIEATDQNACYEMQWRAAPNTAARRPRGGVDLARCAESAAAVTCGMAEVSVLREERGLLASVEARALAHALQALRDLGVASRPGDRIAADVAPSVLPQHRRLARRMLRMLASEGLLHEESDAWVLTEKGARQAVASTEAPTRVEAALLDRCGASLAHVLCGRADALTLLFPEDRVLSAATLYADGSTARVYNRIAGETVASVARAFGGQPLRVLEIGAGTGGTTGAVWPVLPAGSAYFYTDVSPLFLHEAEQRFQGTGLEFTFRKLDIEQAPAAQGFPEGTFDVVIAANVLHATTDLGRTLLHARSLLAPGGVLVLLETTARRRWLDLTFGLTEGWWRFSDIDVRPEQALLSTAQWSEALARAGFEGSRAVGEELSSMSLLPQSVVVARACPPADVIPRVQRLKGTAWLLSADRAMVAASLAESIRGEGGECEVVDAATAEERMSVQWRSHVARLAKGRRLGIVHCGALDAPFAREMRLDSLDANVATATGSALHLARALVEEGADAKLWLVTRGAQRVDAGDRDLSPVQSLLWGFGRSMALEVPDVWGGLIDLDARFSHDECAAALLEELCVAGAEDQVALRASGRRVPRLVARATPRQGSLALNPQGAYLVTGGYGGLGPKVARWLADVGAKCVVLLGRSGLPDPAQWDLLPAGHVGSDAMETIRGLRARGVDVRMERGDVADVDAMRRLFGQIRDSGRPVRGVVHAAASIRFQSLESLTPADLSEAVRAKVQGTWVLHELTRDEPIDLFVMFSSGTAVLGAKGLAAYATANQFQGAIAWERAVRGLPATCVDWGAWSRIRLLGEDRGVGDLGIQTMDDATAFGILAGLVRERVPQCMVASLDVAQVCQAYQAHGARPFLNELLRDEPPSAAEAAHEQVTAEEPAMKVCAELAALPPRERVSRMAGLVRAELARVLRIADADRIDGAKGFFDMGLDSLLAVQLRRRLATLLDKPLPATLTFKYSNVVALSEYLVSLLVSDDVLLKGAAPAPIPAASANKVLDGVADDDIHALLQAELDMLPEDLR